MVKTRDECQLTAYVSLDGNLCYDGQSYGSVVPDKFLLLLDMSDEHETSNALVVVWSGRRSTKKPTHDTAQSERALVRLIDTSS